MTNKIKVRRGLKERLPILDESEFGFCTDTIELFIGSSEGNKLIGTNSTNTTSTEQSSYLLELTRWSIANDGTNALSTSNGINNALQWASDNGYAQIVFPKGTYLIDENTPIEPKSYQTINLNGATLRVQNNSKEKYAIVSFRNNQKYVRITNGKIEGDKDYHDYSSGGTHEGGYGIEFGTTSVPSDGGLNNLRYISIDNMEIFNCTGDAINLTSSFGKINPAAATLATSFEQGNINITNGSLEANSTKIRSTLNIDMTQPQIVNYGYFGLYGDGYGKLGTDITCDYYDVIFYKSDNTFLSSKSVVQFFDEVEVPKDANYAKIVLHQSNIPTPSNCSINVRTPLLSKYIYIEKSNLHHCRRQGISVCGAKNIYIRGNEIHHIVGTAPQAGIDIEDGSDINQHIHISQTNFYENKYNIIVAKGKSIFITDNTLLKTIDNTLVGLTVNNGVEGCIISRNQIKLNKITLSGNTVFSNNYIYGTQVRIAPESSTLPISISTNQFINCKVVINSVFPFVVKVDNCVFLNDVDKLNALGGLWAWTLELVNEPQIFSNCLFEGKDSVQFGYAVSSTIKSGWVFENSRFKNTTNLYLFPAKYINCTFIDLVSPLNLYTSSISDNNLELKDCRITSSDSTNTILSINNLKSFRMSNCLIEKTNGQILKLDNVTKDILLKSNTFKVISDSTVNPIISLNSTFSGSSIIIDGNNISSENNTQIGIENLTNGTATVAIQGNYLKKSTIQQNGQEVLANNVIY